MNILKQANKLLIEKKYYEAYTLYKKIEKEIGRDIIDFNLKLCEKHISLDETNQKNNINISSNKFDIITTILLSNSGNLTISDEEKNINIKIFNDLKNKKTQEIEVKKTNPIPNDWPKNLKLFPLPKSTNDFQWLYEKEKYNTTTYNDIGLSIIIPTFNRSKILDITLACLVNQETKYNFEVIVADDGSKENLEKTTRKYENSLDIKLVRQRDYGYQLCAVRNLGLRTAKYPFVSILDCDMAPNTLWVESYMELLVQNENIALIGPRKYVDTQHISSEQILNDKNLISKLPEVITNNNVAGKEKGTISVDWRLEHFKNTNNLQLCDTPFRFFSGGNVAFAKKWLNIAGWFDEEFTHWGGEDNEFGYRLYREGCF